jgi:hypothetical protein
LYSRHAAKHADLDRTTPELHRHCSCTRAASVQNPSRWLVRRSERTNYVRSGLAKPFELSVVPGTPGSQIAAASSPQPVSLTRWQHRVTSCLVAPRLGRVNLVLPQKMHEEKLAGLRDNVLGTLKKFILNRALLPLEIRFRRTHSLSPLGSATHAGILAAA